MSGRGLPPTVAARRREVARLVAGADGLLVGLDFDGTLAPIAADPNEPTITPACRAAVERLGARPDATVAVISGRELADLRARVGLDGVVYAGNHGLELRRGGETAVHPAAADARPALDGVLDRLADRLADVPGWSLEDKGVTATVHVRGTPPERIDEVRAAVHEAVRAADADLRVVAGRAVFELRPAVGWDKGSVVSLLAAEAPAGWRSVFLGDDVTDEDAFRAVRPDGLGILVGAREDTDATYRLPSRAAVAPTLEWLADLLAGRRRRRPA